MSQNQGGDLLKENALEELGQRAGDAVVEALESSDFSWRLDEQEKASLVQDFAKSIEALNVNSGIQDKEKLCERLVASFDSRAFNRDGSRIIFLPGSWPKFGDVDDRWVFCVWDTVRKETKLTLSGHTDSLVWVSFSPDNRFIASISGDKTFRIWSHADGCLLHTFHSNTQNWTGAFSPDSRCFVGIAVGQLWIWDVVQEWKWRHIPGRMVGVGI